MPKKLISQGFLFALSEGVYIFLVASIIMNAEKIFGPQEPGILPALSFLTLFVLSAAVSGALIFGKPILLYLEGKKSEAVTLFASILGWMFVFLLILGLVFFLMK
jgi:hypothetical protein